MKDVSDRRNRDEGAEPVDERSDRGNGPVEFGPEFDRSGRYNARRARALDRASRFVYEHDRDFYPDDY